MPEESKLFLILDDEASIRQSIAAFMEDEGYLVFEAGSGEEALEIVKTTAIQEAVVDIRLPGIDGNTFMIEARKMLPDLKFVIHTGSSDYRLPDEIRALGITPEKVLIKPVKDLKQILTAMKR